MKLERKVGDFATVGVATRIQLGDDGTITGAGIGVTGVADTPFAATDAETVLVGSAPSDDAVPPRRCRRRGPEPARPRTPADPSTTSARWPPR